MRMTDGIRERGFRRWHERTLLASHGWLGPEQRSGMVAYRSARFTGACLSEVERKLATRDPRFGRDSCPLWLWREAG